MLKTPLGWGFGSAPTIGRHNVMIFSKPIAAIISYFISHGIVSTKKFHFFLFGVFTLYTVANTINLKQPLFTHRKTTSDDYNIINFLTNLYRCTSLLTRPKKSGIVENRLRKINKIIPRNNNCPFCNKQTKYKME